MIRLDDRFKAAWNEAQTNGATVAISDGYLSNHKYMGKLGVNLTTQAAIQLGQIQVGTTYKAALRARPKWRQTLRNVFEQVDFIALPTMQTMAPRKPLFGRSALFEARVLALQNTVAVNYAGNPAIAIPILSENAVFPDPSNWFGPISATALLNAARCCQAPIPTRKRDDKTDPSGWSPREYYRDGYPSVSCRPVGECRSVSGAARAERLNELLAKGDSLTNGTSPKRRSIFLPARSLNRTMRKLLIRIARICIY